MKLTYETAKKLKDAGFPQPSLYGFPIYGEDAINDDGVYYPILSELIDACGDRICVEQSNNGEWLAYQKSIDNPRCWYCGGSSEEMGICQAKTPEEAVAELWLSLNKKG